MSKIAKQKSEILSSIQQASRDPNYSTPRRSIVVWLIEVMKCSVREDKINPNKSANGNDSDNENDNNVRERELGLLQRLLSQRPRVS